jgi:asparagine synthase (glutamine-hydrolysing)
MCGIAGYLLQEGAAAPQGLLERMCDRLVHRGPDGSGYFRDGCIGLGHRRLAIIDLSTGDQPMGNEDGSLQVVFNGEIYNYRELREELVKKGHRFRTKSDTEVLVHLYEEEGERMPERLNGMFAFAIWDAGRQELYLARDRFGKKPLYYTTAVPGMRLAFGSELKALTVLAGFDSRVNPRALADYLSFGYVPEAASIYAAVSKLPPAHSLLVSRAGERLRRYWAPRFEPREGLKLDEAIEEIRALAADSVKRRMISDVPLGAFLSGGVDSSAVVAFMAGRSRAATERERVRERVRTFSIGFTTKEYDELDFARMVAERYSTAHYEEVVTPSIHDVLDVLVKHFDEPFSDNSAIPMLYLSRMTRQHVTVALCGDGADELFGGYRRYAWGLAEERLRRRFPGWFRQTAIKLAGRLYPKFDYLPQVFRARSLLINLSQELGDAYYNSMTIFRDPDLAALLSPDVRGALGGYSTRESYLARFEKVSHLPPLEQMQAVDLETWLPGDILVKADRATMAYSLESRSPWLDYRLGELAGKLPPELKIRGLVGKWVFKRALEPLVPEPVITRRKMGFSVPMAEWLRTSLKETFETTVLSGEAARYLNLAEARRLWGEHQSGFSNHERKLWTLLALALWDQAKAR